MRLCGETSEFLFNPIGGRSPKKPKLLIIEDEEMLRTQMRWALAEEYEVCEVEDRETALEVFKRSGRR